jgi:3-methyladenine DNA glycosylase AlkD
MNIDQVTALLKEKSNLDYLAGMKRFGINCDHALGITIPELRKLAKVIKRDHHLALALWKTNLHEARILASMIDDPSLVTEKQIDDWVKDFNSWDICDQVCGNLFDRTPFVIEKALTFSAREPEYIKRAGFVLMAEYAIHNKAANNEVFINFLPIIEREAHDERNFVRKAVNWALRQIGKRNEILKLRAIETCNRILMQNSKTARWIAANALNELKSKLP